MRDRINRFQVPADVIARMHNASYSAASVSSPASSPERPTPISPKPRTMKREDAERPILQGTTAMSSQIPKSMNVAASSNKRPFSQSFHSDTIGSGAPAGRPREIREVREKKLKEELQRLHTGKQAEYEAHLLTLPMTTIYERHLAHLEKHASMIAVLHKDAKSANGSSFEILRAIEGLRNQTYNLLAEARVISGKQSSTPTTPPSTVLKNQDIPKKEDVSKDEDVLMADHCPQMDGVPTYQKPSVEEVNEEHDRPKGTPNDDPKPSTTYQSKPKPPPLEPTTPNPKRKYAENNGLPPPSTKKVKRHRSPDGNQEPEFVPVIELEDVTAEVDARIRAKDEKRARERARLQDMNPKRKPEPMDPNWIQDGRQSDDPNTERRKKIRIG